MDKERTAGKKLIQRVRSLDDIENLKIESCQIIFTDEFGDCFIDCETSFEAKVARKALFVGYKIGSK